MEIVLNTITVYARDDMIVLRTLDSISVYVALNNGHFE